ncbi:VOC family protein [Alcanivorax sp.]|jgi:catechol 2,3-dioxygenase-like lactoylglutathione lyase family enzyme|uniref:VOC family protein n=1 Tax=Alcanivorax sp. TaxID=1872427 RepID=UPI001991CCC2|nr:VOC family protein [Alcanivorax sp.]MBD3645628.1 VOC family protein [Alcanivorax sp.]
MKISDRYPIVVTEHKVACRDFWQKHFGLDVLFDSDWFVLLGDAQQGSVVAFMSPDHPSAPPGPETFGGLGLCLEIEVEDARQALADFQASDGRVDYPLSDEPFGQRRFGLRDPSGLWVDVVEQIAPQQGYWDRYMQAV